MNLHKVLRARTTPSNPSRSPYELPAPASGTTSSHPYAATYTDSPLYRPQTSNAAAGGDKGKGKAAANAAGGDFLALDFGAPTDSQLGAAEGGYMQMELAQQQGDVSRSLNLLFLSSLVVIFSRC